jgi:hypothetical protein
MGANPATPSSFGQRCAAHLAEVKRERTIRGEILRIPEVGEMIDGLFQAELRVLAVAPQANGKAPSGPEAIYAAYPRHIGRSAALKAIDKALASMRADHGTNAQAYLLCLTEAFATAVQKWEPGERQFIPHPSTWFNQGRYLDDPKEWERGKPETTHADSTDGYKKF